jgi:hypothetical protein
LQQGVKYVDTNSNVELLEWESRFRLWIYVKFDLYILCINFEGISMDSMAAQAFVFFRAGFEASSTTMTFCLYELSLHRDIQDRLRQEIDVVLQKHDGKLTYEGIQEMEYLDKVVSGKTHFCKYIYISRKQDTLSLISLILL